MIDLIIACNKTGRFLLRRPARDDGQWSFTNVYWSPDKTMLQAIRTFAETTQMPLILDQATSIYNKCSRAYFYWCNEEIMPVEHGYEYQWIGLYEMPDKATIDKFIHGFLGDPHFVACLINPQFDS